MAKIATLEDLCTHIAGAVAGVAEMARREPDNNWLFSILRQLEYLDQEAKAGRAALDREGELNFGLLTSHYVDDVAPELAQKLYAIDHARRRLFGGQV